MVLVAHMNKASLAAPAARTVSGSDIYDFIHRAT